MKMIKLPDGSWVRIQDIVSIHVEKGIVEGSKLIVTKVELPNHVFTFDNLEIANLVADKIAGQINGPHLGIQYT